MTCTELFVKIVWLEPNSNSMKLNELSPAFISIIYYRYVVTMPSECYDELTYKILGYIFRHN